MVNLLVKGERVIAKNVFDDLGLNVLINAFVVEEQADDILPLLAYQTDYKERCDRKEIFQDLQNEKVLAFFEQVSGQLVDIQNDFNFMDKYKREEVYKCFLLLNLCNNYLNYLSLFDNPEIQTWCHSKRILDMANYYKAVRESEVHQTFVSELQEVNALFEQHHEMVFKIQTGEEEPMMVRKADQKDVEGIGKQLVHMAKSLGFDEKLRDQPFWARRIQISPYFVQIILDNAPGLYDRVNAFYQQYKDYVQPIHRVLKPQFDFFIHMTYFTKQLRRKGIQLCLPEYNQESDIKFYDAQDISLLTQHENDIIPNDVYFDESSKLSILTGENSGGKTTYIRCMGICIILGLSGCYVPASRAVVGNVNRLMTHFPADERFDNESRLEDERKRLDLMLEECDENAIVLLNETFSSTDDRKCKEMLCTLFEQIKSKHMYGLLVTHNFVGVRELLKSDPSITSLKIAVSEEANRTYKVIRGNMDFRSYTEKILDKYGMSRSNLIERGWIS